MSGLGNNFVISEVEENDLGFSGLWSQPANLECGTMFLNSELPNDIFFNKLTNITCISESMIDEALAVFHKNKTMPFVYSLNYSELETMLQKRNFIHHDTQYALKKSDSTTKASNAHRITNADSMLWSKTFCEAYDCYEWISPVNRIVKKTLSSIEYYVDESISSCMALYEKNSILGLYCLGTIPSMRRKGLADSLIAFAQNKVNQRKLKFLMLETYEKDNLLDFYSKLGFQEIYQKNIFTI
ncbi:MAG TPA: GNAT family N-acetyltransferase [Candidatus Bathyarchaeia archaeon]|nr:GNAT family N-acetyltransferase [Candidatus Bathyarchaeia archaeon]